MKFETYKNKPFQKLYEAGDSWRPRIRLGTMNFKDRSDLQKIIPEVTEKTCSMIAVEVDERRGLGIRSHPEVAAQYEESDEEIA